MQTAPRVLWLEDNNTYVRLMEKEFDSGFRMDAVASYEDLKKIPSAELTRYEAILVDLHLLDGNVGDLAIDLIRDAGLSAPILVLSNDETHTTRVRLLKRGVDDYISKSMPAEEMKLRIGNAITRHRSGSTQKTLSLGNLRMQPLRLLVSVEGKTVELSRLEFHVLLLLLQSSSQSLSLEPFKQEVWRQSVVTDGTINTLLWQLNKKLADWDYRMSKDRDHVVLVRKH